jgi:cytidine deaminase
MNPPQDLLEVARAAQNRAYSPYSNYRVGAAIRLQSGEVFGGCNVENASYGATICAERGAICAATAALGQIEIVEILVISDGDPPWPPCGMCRQVIAEFATQNCGLWCVNQHGAAVFQPFEAIFPRAFDGTFLTK